MAPNEPSDRGRQSDNALSTVIATRVPHEVRIKLEAEAADMEMPPSELAARVLANHVGVHLPKGPRHRGRPKKG